MNENNNDFAILVHACDRYELLYKGFDYFFNRNWADPGNCSYYFATEEKEAEIAGFRNIQSGKGQWSDRLSTLLKRVPEKYILYFQEDMWLSKPVNPHFFSTLVATAMLNEWQLVKLHSSGVYVTQPTGLFIEGFNVARLDNDDSNYLMSHQVSLWNKEFLLKQLPGGEHPWRNERRGTKRLRKTKPEIFHVDYFAENGHPEINNNNEPILRSEYYSVSKNASFLPTALPFIEEMKTADAGLKAYAEKLEDNFQHNLTHDGLPRPKKDDIFKKIRNRLKI